MIDYYEILEISPNASAEVIREVYKVLLHRYNLEHDPEDYSEVRRLRNIKLAYEVLSDPDKREIYDNDLYKFRKARNGLQDMSQSKDMGMTKTAGGADGFKWKRWSWLVSILAVVIVLISMVRPDPEKLMRGQLAVNSEALREKAMLVDELKETDVENPVKVAH